MISNLWTFTLELFNVVVSVGATIWEILTTPVIQYIDRWEIPGWLDLIIREPIKWIFGTNGTILSFLPLVIGVLIIVRIVFLFRGR